MEWTSLDIFTFLGILALTIGLTVLINIKKEKKAANNDNTNQNNSTNHTPTTTTRRTTSNTVNSQNNQSTTNVGQVNQHNTHSEEIDYESFDYYLYLNNKVCGPFKLNQVKRQPGFTSTTLVTTPLLNGLWYEAKDFECFDSNYRKNFNIGSDGTVTRTTQTQSTNTNRFTVGSDGTVTRTTQNQSTNTNGFTVGPDGTITRSNSRR